MCKYKADDWVGATELIKLKPTDYECTFSRGKAGPRPLPWGVHLKIQMGMAHPIFLGLKFGQILFFFWGCQKLALSFRLHKALFTHDYNVIFRNCCVAIASKICNPATPVHGARAKFADK